jgi:hypothetical protein
MPPGGLLLGRRSAAAVRAWVMNMPRLSVNPSKKRPDILSMPGNFSRTFKNTLEMRELCQPALGPPDERLGGFEEISKVKGPIAVVLAARSALITLPHHRSVNVAHS